MKSPSHDASPPGLCTATEAAGVLGMSRQFFYQSGLAEAIERWKVGRVTLYKSDDVAGLAHWLFVRRGLIGLGIRPGDYPANPTDGEYHAANHDGRWDQTCPVCAGPAVGEDYPEDAPVWCPEHAE